MTTLLPTIWWCPECDYAAADNEPSHPIRFTVLADFLSGIHATPLVEIPCVPPDADPLAILALVGDVREGWFLGHRRPDHPMLPAEFSIDFQNTDVNRSMFEFAGSTIRVIDGWLVTPRWEAVNEDEA